MQRAPFTSVDDYIARAPPHTRAALVRLRKIVRAAAPRAVESITYQIPTFKLHGERVIYFAGFEDHCSLFIMDDAVRQAFKKELGPYSSGRATVQFDPRKPFPAALLKRIVKMRVAQLEALPDGLAAPARRALAASGVKTRSDLAKLSDAKLKALHSIGPSAMKTLKAARKKATTK